jgi:hypothetical protein
LLGCALPRAPKLAQGKPSAPRSLSHIARMPPLTLRLRKTTLLYTCLTERLNGAGMSEAAVQVQVFHSSLSLLFPFFLSVDKGERLRCIL